MISRILIPKDAAPLSTANGVPRRGSTFLDSRQIIPAELPVVQIDGRSNIPKHVPLEVIAENLLVPRDAGAAPFSPPSTARLPLTALDDRVVIPRGVQPQALEIRADSKARHAAVLDPDLLTTGEVNLLTHAVEEETTGWKPAGNWQSGLSSILFHAMLVVLFILQPKYFPAKPPTTEEIESARRMLGTIYIPPDLPVTLAPPPPVPQIKVDPRVFKQIAPPDAIYQPPTEPAPGKASPQPEAEASRGGRVDNSAPPVAEPPRSSLEAPRQPRFEPPKQPDAQKSPFALPNLSAGRALEDSLRGAAKNPGGQVGSFGGEVPRQGSGGGGGGGSGSGSTLAHGLMELLTPTEGVDFTHYLNRVLASVRRNWYAVIPESARLGEKGIVVLEFRIMKDGSVPQMEPTLVRTSGRDPLDFAASSSIRSSNPFEPLPQAFSGPFIALRFTFLYNLPLDTPR